MPIKKHGPSTGEQRGIHPLRVGGYRNNPIRKKGERVDIVNNMINIQSKFF